MSRRLVSFDLPDRLEFRLTEQHTRPLLILRGLAWLCASVIVIALSWGSPLFAIFTAGIILFCAVNDMTKARRGTDVTFTVTERDIISDGYTQNEYYPVNRWRLRASDLSWQDKRSSEDGPTYPRGVYCGGDCVLPLVEMDEGHRIIAAVYTRFPDTSSDSPYDKSAEPSPIITLDLSKT